MIRATVFAILTVLGAASYAASVDSPNTNSSESGVAVGLKAITDVLGDLRRMYQTKIVDPESRAQAARYLRRLSNRLSDVAIEKQQLTHDILASSLPADLSKLRYQIRILQTSIEALRRSLTSSFEAMPPDWQSKRGELEVTLTHALGGKWERLQGLAQSIESEHPPANKDLVKESKEIEELLGKAKSAVDELVNDLAGNLKRPEADIRFEVGTH